MSEETHLKNAAILSVIASLLLVIATIVANSYVDPASQELFEYIRAPDQYAYDLMAAGDRLRLVLTIDAVFILTFTGAIGFATIGFARRNQPVAWFCGLGIVAVMLLDYAENNQMVQSLDILQAGGEVGFERIAAQATISALKWQVAAAMLFALSFLLPGDGLVEKLLVWGTRLGLPVAVPLFVVNGFGLRDIGSLVILASMLSGFVLLAIVAWNRASDHQGLAA